MYNPFYGVLYRLGQILLTKRVLKAYLKYSALYVAVPVLMSLRSQKLQFGTAIMILGVFSYAAQREQKQKRNPKMETETD